MEKSIHHGNNIKRIREMIGMKQEALAFELGPNWSQKKISSLEQKEEISKDIINEISEILDVPANLIYQFSEEFMKCLFHQIPTQLEEGKYIAFFIEKWLNGLEENKQLYVKLWESEKEKVKILERALQDLKCNQFETKKGFDDS